MVDKLAMLLNQFSTHKELILNVSRILARISSNYFVSESLRKLGKPFLKDLMGLLQNYDKNTAIAARVVYVLGNQTTNYETARMFVGAKEHLDQGKTILTILNNYLQCENTG